MNDEDETVDVEGDSELEDWSEVQARRAAALVGTIPSSTGRTTEIDNEADDVIVDGDDPEEHSFGPSQYTESDVVVKETKEKDGQSQVATVNSTGDVEVKVESNGQQCDSNVSTSDAEPSSRIQLIEELRNRIRQLEAEGGGETATSTDPEDYKCLICLVRFIAGGVETDLLIFKFVTGALQEARNIDSLLARSLRGVLVAHTGKFCFIFIILH